MLMYSTDPTRAMNEYGGIAISQFIPCFDKHEIARMFDTELYNTLAIPNLIFIEVDPNGGGMSNMAIVTGYYNREFEFVVSFYILYIYFLILWSCHVCVE